MASNARVILADEPTGAVDSANALKIVELFHKLNDMGKTVIIVTHNPDVAASCKKQIQIVDGMIIQ